MNNKLPVAEISVWRVDSRQTGLLLCTIMSKCSHGLAPHYLSNAVTMHFDIHGYDTRSGDNMNLYLPHCSKEIYKRSFLYKGSSLWNELPIHVKESTSLSDFKYNYLSMNTQNTTAS